MSKPQKKVTSGTQGSISKQDTVLRLLKRKNGATIDDIFSKTGWQAHSARGFLSGTVRKKLAFNLHSEKDANGTRRYRVEQASVSVEG